MLFTRLAYVIGALQKLLDIPPHETKSKVEEYVVFSFGVSVPTDFDQRLCFIFWISRLIKGLKVQNSGNEGQKQSNKWRILTEIIRF